MAVLPQMVIVWGSYPSSKVIGLVAEACPTCHAVQPHAAIDRFSMPHVYFIPVWAPIKQGSDLVCQSCGDTRKFKRKIYENVLPTAAAANCTLNELIQQTNRHLASMTSLASATQEGPPPQLVERLAASYKDPRCQTQLEQLRRWASLSAEARTKLVAELERFLELRDQDHTARQFLLAQAASAALEWQGYATMILVALGIFCSIASSILITEKDLKIFSLLGGLILTGIFAWWFYRTYNRARFKAWCRDRLLPAAAEAGIDPIVMISLLSEENKVNSEAPPHLNRYRALAKRWRMIAEVCVEQGIALPDAEFK